MNALALFLTLAVVPAFAADAPSPSSPGPGSSPVPAKDQQPKPGTDNIGSAYAMDNFEEVLAAEQKQRESELNDALKGREFQYNAQKDLETRQMKEKFEFLRKRVDERKAFERAGFDDWKKFMEKLRTIPPAERNAAKLQFDRAAMDGRHKQEDDSQKLVSQFMEKQQHERDDYWVKIQKENDDRERQQQEHVYRSVKSATPASAP
jgi:hypothetical protein